MQGQGQIAAFMAVDQADGVSGRSLAASQDHVADNHCRASHHPCCHLRCSCVLMLSASGTRVKHH